VYDMGNNRQTEGPHTRLHFASSVKHCRAWHNCAANHHFNDSIFKKIALSQASQENHIAYGERSACMGK